MGRDSMMRAALWTSVPLNFRAALVLAFPASAPGQLLGLPTSVSPIYATLSAFFIALFGGAYVWLAIQPTIDRPLVGFATIGKAGVFAAIVILSLLGQAPARGVLAGIPDLVLAVVFARWLLVSRSPPTGATR